MSQLPTPRESPRIPPCVAAVALLVVALVAPAARGQQPQKAPADAEPEVLNWDVTISGTAAFGVSSSDLEGAMSGAGYGQAQSSGGLLAASVSPSIRYRIGERFALGLSGASAKIGETATTGAAAVTIHRTSADVAALFFWRPVTGARFGAGPAWYRLTASPDGGAYLTASRIGAAFEAGFVFPEAGRWYVDFAFQYRLTGKADLGSYTPPQKGPRANAPIPLDGIPFSHAAFLAGIGYRF